MRCCYRRCSWVERIILDHFEFLEVFTAVQGTVYELRLDSVMMQRSSSDEWSAASIVSSRIDLSSPRDLFAVLPMWCRRCLAGHVSAFTTCDVFHWGPSFGGRKPLPLKPLAGEQQTGCDGPASTGTSDGGRQNKLFWSRLIPKAMKQWTAFGSSSLYWQCAVAVVAVYNKKIKQFL